MLKTRRMANRYRNLLVLCVALFLAYEVIIFAYVFVFNFLTTGLLIAYIPMPLVPVIVYSWIEYQTWGSGAEGEEKVAEALRSLKGYDLLHDIMLPGERSNIDHVVISPYGVFVVETKNQRGSVRCVGDSWEFVKVGRKGTPYAGKIGNPSKQVKRNALILRDFILDRVGIRIWVNGIVCFTNPDCELDVNEPTVDVVRLEELGSCILTYRASEHISIEEIAQIRTELERYSSVLE